MSDQLASWLRDSAVVLSLIADNLHELGHILRELSRDLFAVGALVVAWRWLQCRWRQRKRMPRKKR